MSANLLQGKIALVTGAGSGIGRALAVGLAAHGAHVAIVGRRVAKLEETAAAIRANGGQALAVAADVANVQDVAAMAETVLERWGTPAVLINAAGVYLESGSIARSDPQKWIETIMINTVGPYLVCRAFAERMAASGWGRIVNVSSAAALGTPSGAGSAYATSKAALNHFTRQLAAELEGTGVTANVFHPGEVKTEMFEQIRDHDGGEMSGWVSRVERSGGDSPDKSVQLAIDLMKPERDRVTGRFLWIESGLTQPLPSWD